MSSPRALRRIVVSQALLTAILTVVVGCGSTSLSKPDGGAAGSGGAGSDGGIDDGAAGGQSGGGGAGAGGSGASLGSVTVRLVLPAGRSFCGCNGGLGFTILDGAGVSVGNLYGRCSTTPCSTCTFSPCAAIPCVPEPPRAESGFTWDGTTFATTASTCGNHVACELPTFAPAGQYVARMCATPGTFTSDDGGVWGTCSGTGTMECVDVSFDYPSESVIVGTLP
jgi:hypothetical protein